MVALTLGWKERSSCEKIFRANFIYIHHKYLSTLGEASWRLCHIFNLFRVFIGLTFNNVKR